MPYSYTPLWNLLNEHNMSKSELCQKLRISSSTMAKMTNNQKVSMDILARICDYFACNLQKVVIYVNEIEQFANTMERQGIRCAYTLFSDQWPEFRFQLNDAQMQRLSHITRITLQSAIKECEFKANRKYPCNGGIIDTTKFSVVTGRNMVSIQGSFAVIELFIPWLLQQVTTNP